MHLDPILITILVGAFVLAVGAAMRMAAQRVRVPYTVGMLLIGVVAGLILRTMHANGVLHEAFQPLATGAVLSDHIVLFVFLPALVFESAFAMDVYSFSKNLGAVLVLAIPALLVATFATAALMLGLTAGNWGWSLGVALVFGALISATDPVAVVAILRELGAPKRLSLLIEGESLLNDGTSIVIFTVLVGMLTAAGVARGHAAADAGGGLDIGAAVLRFLLVVGGGLTVGLVLAAITSFCLSRIFDDPLVEVTLMIALAYFCMAIAEGLLHVSGVVAVVAAGLWMAGPGRQSISPGAEHTIHRFWEILAYLANTLIFCLVGFTIAAQFNGADLTWVWLVPAAWIGIMAIRFVVVFGSMPVINRIGEPVSTREAVVMSWGGLRGAVSLALALFVLHMEGVPHETRAQILRVTAGVVFLTVAVNGTTTGWLLRVLGFNRVPPGEKIARLEAHRTVLESVGQSVDRLSQSPNLRLHAWTAVRQELAGRANDLRADLRSAHDQLDAAGELEHQVLLWRRAIGIERSAVNRAFADGTLTPTAVQIMELEIDFHLDRLAAGRLQPPDARTRGIHEPGLAQWARKFGMLFGARSRGLSLLYDVTRAEAISARAVLDGLTVLDNADDGDGEGDGNGSRNATVVSGIRETYTAWLRDANERLEDLRVNLQEVTDEIEARLARRIELNLERDNYNRLRSMGIVDEAVTGEALESVQRRMKQLQFAAPTVTVPAIAELCRSTPLFRKLDHESVEALSRSVVERVFEKGQNLLSEGDHSANVYLIARGAVHIVRGSGESEVLLDVAGGGDLVGEMALLTGAPRNATVRAATTVVVGEIDGTHFRRLMTERPDLRVQVVAAFARHGFDNYIRSSPDWQHLTHDDVATWIGDPAPQYVTAGDAVPDPGDGCLFLVSGSIRGGEAGQHWRAPQLLTALDAAGATADADAWAVCIGPAPNRPQTVSPARMTRRMSRAAYESRKLPNS